MAAYSDEQYEKGGHEEVCGATIYRETIRMQKIISKPSFYFINIWIYIFWSHNRRRLCQTFLNYTQNHEKISSVIARIYRPDVCLFKRRSRSAGWTAYPRQPGRREAVTIPDEFLCSYLLKYFDLDRNGELSATKHR